MLLHFQSGSVEDGQGDTAVPSMALPTGAPPVGKEERRGGDGAEDISVVAPAVETQCETVGATTTDRSPSVSVERETSLASGESKAQSVAETVPKVKDSSRSRRKEDKSIGEFHVESLLYFTSHFFTYFTLVGGISSDVSRSNCTTSCTPRYPVESIHEKTAVFYDFHSFFDFVKQNVVVIFLFTKMGNCVQGGNSSNLSCEIW